MALLTVERVSALAAIVAAVFAGYSGYVARQTMLTAHRDAIDQIRQTQRAYMGVQIGEVNEVGKTQWTAEFRAIGGSPALHVDAQMHVLSIDDDADPGLAISAYEHETKHDPKEPEIYLIEDALILPGNGQTVPLETVKPVNFKPHMIDVYFGAVSYTDVFNQRHTTHYCIRLGNFCRSGNDAN